MLISLRRFVESQAGQLIISLLLMLIGIGLLDPQSRGEIGKQLVMFALGVMSRSMETKSKVEGNSESRG